MAALQLLLSALLLCQVYSAPTIAPTVTVENKQHLITTNADTSIKSEEIVKDSEEPLLKSETENDQTKTELLSSTESSVKTTFIVQEQPKTVQENTFDPIRESTGFSDETILDSITEKSNDDKLIATEGVEPVDRQDPEINENVPTNNVDYPTSHRPTTEDGFSSDPIDRDIVQEQEQADAEDISPDPIPPDFVSESQTDEMIDGPLAESEIITDEMIGTHVFPAFVPDDLREEPIEPPVDETPIDETPIDEEAEMDLNPPSITPDEGLPDANEDPLPVADDIVEEVPEIPPEKMEEEDSGPINII